jgi:hypothetical protein
VLALVAHFACAQFALCHPAGFRPGMSLATLVIENKGGTIMRISTARAASAQSCGVRHGDACL